jgi:hypothetical protein
LIGDRSTKSSANSRHLTSDSSRVRPGAANYSSALDNLLIYMLKRVGLKLHLIPQPCGKKCMRFLLILAAHLLFWYMDFIMFMFSPNMTFHLFTVYSRPSCQIESKAFFKSTKHEKTLPLFWFICLSIRVCRVNTWSVVRLFGKKPI